MLVYFALGLIGLLLLGASVVLGEFHDLLNLDFGDHADGTGPISGKTVAVTLTAFGATGMLSVYFGLQPLPGAIVAGSVALAVGAAAAWLIGLIYSQSSSSEITMSTLRGRLASVTTAIPAGDVGQVLFTDLSGTKQLLARTSDGSSLPAGSTVRIVSTSAGIVIVEAAERPGHVLFDPEKTI